MWCQEAVTDIAESVLKKWTRGHWHSQLLESPGHVTPLCSISGPDWVGAHKGIWVVFGSLSSTKSKHLSLRIMGCIHLLAWWFTHLRLSPFMWGSCCSWQQNDSFFSVFWVSQWALVSQSFCSFLKAVLFFVCLVLLLIIRGPVFVPSMLSRNEVTYPSFPFWIVKSIERASISKR